MIKSILDISSKYGKIFLTHRSAGKKKVDVIRDFEWYFYILGRDKEKFRPVAKFCKKIEKHDNDYLKVYCDNDDLNRFDLEKGKIDNKTIVIRHCLQHAIPTFEADHGAWKRYLIDEGMEIDPKPILTMLDIETRDDQDGIMIGRDQILSFAACINGKAYFYCDDDERKVLLKIRDCFEYSDIICGWNSEFFDIPYILARFQVHGIQYYKNNIIHFDLMEIFKKRYKFSDQDALTNFNLEYICQLFLGKGKIKHAEKIYWLFKNDRKRLCEYNKQDVLLLHELNEKLGIMDLNINTCVESHTPYRYYYISELVDNYILQEAKTLNRIMPSNMWKLENKDGSSDKQKYQGSVVFGIIPGIYDDVSVYDLNSQYPNTIITFNIGLDTKIDDITNLDTNSYIKTINGCYFRNDIKSINAIVAEKLLKIRQSIKDEMKLHDKNSMEYKVLNNRSDVIKVLGNSQYGALGSQYTRYYSLECSEAITLSSQYILKWMHKYLTINGNRIIAGDTDSLFVA